MKNLSVFLCGIVFLMLCSCRESEPVPEARPGEREYLAMIKAEGKFILGEQELEQQVFAFINADAEEQTLFTGSEAYPVNIPNARKTALYVLHTEKGGSEGFIIACNDKRVGIILAIIEEDPFAIKVKWFDDIVLNGIESFINHKIALFNNITGKEKRRAPVKSWAVTRQNGNYIPVKARWNQGWPYNYAVFTELGVPQAKGVLAGTGPAALGRFLSYYRYPHRFNWMPHGSEYYGRQYDWENMPQDFNRRIDARNVPNSPVMDVAILFWELFGWSNTQPASDRGDWVYTKPEYFINALWSMKFVVPTREFIPYDFDTIQESVTAAGAPVFAYGNEEYWFLDGVSEIQYYADSFAEPFVRCNIGKSAENIWNDQYGWGGPSGWYASGIFSPGETGYGVQILPYVGR